ncbi:uncharacterized protein LTR77_008572 [Saxophila tyrrhenica]|uniref:ASST-domain-containing protein n=1 Tax=Saxophila tyrrhenica TaxID=1690608 RepID=A0AAV9P1Q9_9PEZI|nr:hypothetical protein LTR77_008572 [Saxophila tyrrhenica]
MHPWLVTALAGFALADQPVLHDFESYQNGTHVPEQTYYSSDITSPVFNYGEWRKDLILSDRSFHLFFTLDYTGAGPYIFRDDDLSLVYSDPSFDYAMNARVQSFDGKQYLTFWHGARNRGDSQGFCVFYDEHYQLAWNVTLGAPLTVDADMHECAVTSDDTVLLTAYQDKRFDLTSIGGSTNDMLADSCFQELNIVDSEVLFTWCASDHFSPDMTYWNYTSTFDTRRRGSADDTAGSYTTSSGIDVYHINSLQRTAEGNYLVSLRNLKTLVYIDGKTGKPVWNLNGKLNDFTDVTSPEILSANEGSEGALGFGWQHHARFWDDAISRITFFDNHELSTQLGCTGPSCSRGREVRITTSNPENLTVELVHDFRSSHGLKSVIFGSMHPLPYPDGPTKAETKHYLVSWGVNAEFTEHTSDGRLIRDVQYSPLYSGHSVGGIGVQSSRVYKQSWVGKPLWPPSIAFDRNGTLWVSWNGATEVKEWVVFGSDTAAAFPETEGSSREGSEQVVEFMYPLEPLVRVARAGFETKIELGHERPAYVKVFAHDVNGQVIGYTGTLWLGHEMHLRYKDTLSYIALSGLLV